MLAFVVTPKSVSFTVLLRIVPHISYFMPVSPGPVCRHVHFPKLNNICHLKILNIGKMVSYVIIQNARFDGVFMNVGYYIINKRR